MAQAEFIQLEVATMGYNEGAPEAADTIAFMHQHQFEIFEIAGFIRPTKAEVVTLDIIFAKRNSSFRKAYFTFG